VSARLFSAAPGPKGPAPFDLHGLKTYDLAGRPSRVFRDELGRPVGPEAGLAEWLDALPRQLAGRDLRRLADHLCRARHEGRPARS
jgi:hypothetical protein